MKIGKIFNTVRYLKLIQIYWRIYLKLVRILKPKINSDYVIIQVPKLATISQIEDDNITIFGDKLSDKNVFGQDYSGKSKLWKYHLYYFDFLRNCNKEFGLQVISNWIETNPVSYRADAWEPYPISLRVVNWIQFLSKHNIQPNAIIAKSLKEQMEMLYKQREFHLLANHFFKNIIALLYLGFLFDDKKIFQWSLKYLEHEIIEQTSESGMHYEYSPTYHAIYYKDLLDAYNLIINNDIQIKFADLLSKKIEKASYWINHLSINNKFINFADMNYEGCLTAEELVEYSNELHIRIQAQNSSELFPKIKNKNAELILLNAPFSPKYNAAHSHADKLSILLWRNSEPILVDTGNYIYLDTDERRYSRSVYAHNTIQIDEWDQAELWGAFRIGKRGVVEETVNRESKISSCYKTINYSHNRSVEKTESGFRIIDDLWYKPKGASRKIKRKERRERNGHAEFSAFNSVISAASALRKQLLKNGIRHDYKIFFHFAPEFEFQLVDNELLGENGPKIIFPNNNIEILETPYFPEMFKQELKKTVVIKGNFTDTIKLTTEIYL